ncbi:hypothetical protein ASE80_16820 [Pseudomonas sp. Leaf15]|uniref:hypothetical protein n=1 Tax=unclassified Pseudomonas TaxID=196821 RepID=UPI000702D116|nr:MULTISPECIES: hypothetical protein [unclassified Pseudomonas]KQM46418.1 hypothetical protein ASE80_16820 [Pseudomonas sp. Leaf15]RAH01651.1 hypothetical protein DJ480_16760 [Pseudomonas sp. Leaf98]
MSQKTRIKFTIGELDPVQPNLQMWFQDSVDGLPDNPPVFELPPGTSMEQAEEIAKFLNKTLISFRLFSGESFAQSR